LKTDSNHELKSTLGHKIYSNNKWVFAHELNVGDVLLDSDGNNSKIISLEIIKGEFEVYHILNVGSDHTYFSNGLLVHNFSFYGYGGPPPGYACFVSDTKVLMNDGSEKNIEDIVVGDEVLSYNEEKRLIESKKVINLKSPIHDDLVEYTLSNGIKITSTFDHPYYVNGLNLASYLPSKTQHLKELGLYNIENEIHQIKIGDFVNLADKQTAEIISIVELDRVDTQTYIISVEDNHNFYANQILVHNKI
jgi:intein/homing endonuclease